MKQLIGCLLLVGFVCVYWKFVLAIVVLVLIVRAVPVAWREYQTERAQRAEVAAGLVERATIQDQWYLQGNPRGIYGWPNA